MIQVMNDLGARVGPGLAIPEGCRSRLSLLLARVGGVLLDLADDTLQVAGIGGREYAALAVLSDDRPRSQLELARLMGKAPALMVAVVDGLEAQGLVERTRDPDDRRRSVVRLTAAGRRTLERADRMADTLVAQLLGGLDDDERQELLAVLQRAVAAEPRAGAPVD
jgi:DNA-binding MarR family transcriptional regulator